MENPKITPPRDRAEIFIIDISRVGATIKFPENMALAFHAIFNNLLRNLQSASEYMRRLDNIFRDLYASYLDFYGTVPLSSFDIITEESTNPRDLFISPELLAEELEYISNNAKDGDLIRIIAPYYE